MTDDHGSRFTHHGRAEWVVVGLICIFLSLITVAILIGVAT